MTDRINEAQLDYWARQAVDWRGNQIVVEYNGTDPESVVSGAIEDAELHIVYRVDQVPNSNVVIATKHLPTDKDNHRGIPENRHGLR